MCLFEGDIQIDVSGLGNPSPPVGDAAETRRVLGIPDDCPVIATGHQPVPPHPGILAKYMVARHLAEGIGGVVVNVVVDTVDIEVGLVEIPLGTPPLGLSLSRAALLRESTGVLAARPAGESAAWSEQKEMSVATRQGLVLMASMWAQAEGATAATQAASMINSLIRPIVGDVVNVFASELLATPIGIALLEAIRLDPSGCLQAWNDACRAYPEVGVGQLRASPEIEVPLWVLESEVRRPATVHDLAEPQSLLPRGLVTSAIMRCGGCDAFVHGLGGWRYDRVMEQWIAGWLGWPLVGRCLATADVRLPRCRELDLISAEKEQRRLRHDPANHGGAGLSLEKAAMLRQIDACSPGTGQRRQAWDAMHGWLDRVGAVPHSVGAAAVARKRDWPFLIYPQKSMDALAAALTETINEAEALPDSMPC